MRFKLLEQFLKLESASGIVLFFSAFISMIWANSSLAMLHQQFNGTFLFWINEGLMSVFFLLVGLELKRGFLDGQLSSLSQIILPAFAALGGMLIPAVIYALVNHGNSVTLKGWATPVATDIAFALGALSVFGRRIPYSLKLFLLTLAIFDDLGAILIITVFYANNVCFLSLFQAAILLLILCIFNVLRIVFLTPYLLVGTWLWLCLVHSGLHPSLAGVLLAFTIPNSNDLKSSPLDRLERILNPWVGFVIMPLFALANTGFSLQGLTLDILTDMVVLGIVLGLFVGKQVGVFGFSWLLIRMKWSKLPKKTSWSQLYGVALLCGIGFTMSLFLGTLSFQNEVIYLSEVRLGVMIGSILSGITGILVLFTVTARIRSKIV